MAKNAARQDVIASHAEEQTRGAESAGKRATKGCQNENPAHRVEQNDTTYALANIHECGFQIGKCAPIRPNKLRQIDQKASKNAGKDANQYRCEQHIAFRILDVFCQCGYAVESDVGKRRKRGRSPYAMAVKCARIV